MKHDPNFMDAINREIESRKAASRILEVDELISEQPLKKAYRIATAKYHPDHNGNTSEANRRFILVQCAYELLAFDKSLDKLLDQVNSWPGVPEDEEYRLDNPWGHFLWWRKKFFDAESAAKRKQSKGYFCI